MSSTDDEDPLHELIAEMYVGQGTDGGKMLAGRLVTWSIASCTVSHALLPEDLADLRVCHRIDSAVVDQKFLGWRGAAMPLTSCSLMVVRVLAWSNGL